MTPKDIKKLRTRLGLTQNALAQLIPTTVTTISRWECGDRHPTGLYAKRLEDVARRKAQ